MAVGSLAFVDLCEEVVFAMAGDGSNAPVGFMESEVVRQCKAAFAEDCSGMAFSFGAGPVRRLSLFFTGDPLTVVTDGGMGAFIRHAENIRYSFIDARTRVVFGLTVLPGEKKRIECVLSCDGSGVSLRYEVFTISTGVSRTGGPIVHTTCAPLGL